MALDSHRLPQPRDAVSAFAENAGAGGILRPVVRMQPVEDIALVSSGISVGFEGAVAAETEASGRRYADSFVAERERVALQDGLGAMRGFVLVLGLYVVMGALGLGGLMLWHWLM